MSADMDVPSKTCLRFLAILATLAGAVSAAEPDSFGILSGATGFLHTDQQRGDYPFYVKTSLHPANGQTPQVAALVATPFYKIYSTKPHSYSVTAIMGDLPTLWTMSFCLVGLKLDGVQVWVTADTGERFEVITKGKKTAPEGVVEYWTVFVDEALLDRATRETVIFTLHAGDKLFPARIVPAIVSPFLKLVKMREDEEAARRADIERIEREKLAEIDRMIAEKKRLTQEWEAERKATDTRRNAYVAAHAGLPDEVKFAILKGDVVIGMDMEAVLASAGKPDSRDGVAEAEGSAEAWVYHGRNGVTNTLYFVNGKLVRLARHEN